MFEPSLVHGSVTTLSPFRYWCQKVLPLVYDNSLSYYELLCKVVEYLNETMENVNTIGENTNALYNSYLELTNYVNNYFNNLDVQEEINNKLDAMAESGELTQLMFQYLGYVTPQMFGAKGDGVTDDSVAIQMAIDTGKKVFIPKGIYLVNTITFPSFCVIEGENREATIIKGNGNIVLKSDKWDNLNSGSEDITRYFYFSNFTVDGNNISEIGVAIYGKTYELRNIDVKNCVSQGLYSGYTKYLGTEQSNGVAMEALISNSRIHHCGMGMFFSGPHDSKIENSEIYLCDNGALFTNTENSYVEGLNVNTLHIYACTNIGVEISGYINATNLISETCGVGLKVNNPCNIGVNLYSSTTNLIINTTNAIINGQVKGDILIENDGYNKVNIYCDKGFDGNTLNNANATSEYVVFATNAKFVKSRLNSISLKLSGVGEENGYTANTLTFVCFEGGNDCYARTDGALRTVKTNMYILNKGDSIWWNVELPSQLYIFTF